MTSRNRFFVRSASVASLAIALAYPAAVLAQTADEAAEDDIVVTGVRASLDRSIDIKRNSTGVVDAISAEDIGKFPDSNLAESLQRVTGVSIDRVNGEGSEVTVRGFGGGYNLVTLNGRTMPTANVATVGGDQSSDYATGSSRSFDFSNLASEGVRTLEVYKTSRAAVPSGGIGASINISTRRPLDTRGLSASLGVKALYDLSTDEGSRITPEVSGLASWSNDAGTLGIGLFGSYQKRNNSAVGATVNDWNVERLSSFLNPANGRVTATTVIANRPTTDQLVAYPNDSRYEFSEFRRERINGQLVVQVKPFDALTLTADATYFRNDTSEQRGDQANWFNRPFAEVRFDNDPVVATTTFLRDTISGAKDSGFEQQYRATRDELRSFGLNAEFEAADGLTFRVDGHISRSSSNPNNPDGKTSTIVAFASKATAGHTLDFTSGFPVQTVTFNDNPATGGNGNANGILDLADLGTQVARTFTTSQSQRVKEIRGDGAWEFGDDDRFDFGVGYRRSSMRQTALATYQPLGDWGVANVGDVQQLAPGLLTQFCLTCKFDDFNPRSTGSSLIAFRGDATKLSRAFNARYAPGGSSGAADNRVRENIFSAYGQVTLREELASMPATLVAGLRYESTKSRSTSFITVPQAIVWQADNDFTPILSSTIQPVSGTGDYDNWLPSIDFSIEPMSGLVARASFSKSLGRSDYGSLFASASANQPNRPTALGGIPTGNSGNPGLLPLVSTNFDLSLEWYFARSSYISVGYFNKNVKNFVGTGQTTRNLFGLRDPSSGAAGSRSGAARAALTAIGASQSDVNLFTMTALIDALGATAADAAFRANFSNGNLSQAFIDQTLQRYDVTANATDPLFQFQVQQPVNNRTGKIDGFEFAAQYFLGDTGFGIAGAYTLVNGDVKIDRGADPSADQFALVGLSDTANATLIYENSGFSARVAYNWRSRFLSATNRGGYRNPVFVAPYSQIDFSLSYDVNEQLNLAFEGQNLTSSSIRTYGRSEKQLWFALEQKPRFFLGARYKF